jgi:hypothetical protein
MVISLLVASALYVTARGRDITSYYNIYTGMYDLAAAGNEHVYSFFETALNAPVFFEDEQERRVYVAGEFEKALGSNGFINLLDGYLLNWNIEVVTDVREAFVCETKVVRDGVNFVIISVINKQTDEGEGSPCTVQLEIIWPETFDGNKPPVLKSKRIAQ